MINSRIDGTSDTSSDVRCRTCGTSFSASEDVAARLLD
jgi:hypothetical protein